MSFRFGVPASTTGTTKSFSLFFRSSSSKLLQKITTTPKLRLDLPPEASSWTTTATLFFVVATIGGSSCLLFGNSNHPVSSDTTTRSVVNLGSIVSLFPTRIHTHTTLLDGANGNTTADPPKNNDNGRMEHDRYNVGRWMNRWSKGDTRWHNPKVHPMLYKYTHLLLDDADPKTIDATFRTKNILVPLCGKSVDMKYLASLPLVSSTNDNKNRQKNVFHVVGIDCIELAMEEFASDPNNTELNLVKKDMTITTGHDPKSKIQQIWWFGKSISLLVTNFFQVTRNDVVTGLTTNAIMNESTSHQGTVASKKLSPANNTIAIDAVWDRGSLVAIDPSLRQEYVKVIGKLMSKSSNGGGRYLLATIVRGNVNDKNGPPFTVSKNDVYELFENESWVDSIELLETRSATADYTSWYSAIMGWYRLGFFAKEVIYLIKTK